MKCIKLQNWGTNLRGECGRIQCQFKGASGCVAGLKEKHSNVEHNETEPEKT